MMNRVVITQATLALVATAFSVSAQEVTFTKDVLPILQENCQDCHRPSGRNVAGMVAPMSFMNYEETRPWAKAIAKAVENRVMPPWHAAKEFDGVFHEERSLAEDEVETIGKWVKQGAKRGNPSDAPAPLEFSETGWSIRPDLVITFDEPFWVPDDATDLQVDVWGTVPEGTLTEDKWIRSIEFKPGSEQVHHYIAYECEQKADGSFVDTTGAWLGAGAPGTTPFNYPDGYGIKWGKNSDLRFNMHYFKESGPGTGIWDQSSFAIQFQDTPVTHPVNITAVAGVPDFEVPPFNAAWRVGGGQTFKRDTHLVSVAPHTHFRGVEAKYTAFYPDGTSEVLFYSPNYEYAWQNTYSYKEIKEIPAGTRVEWEVTYDNSNDNAAARGFNPAQIVNNGLRADDEMAIGFYAAADAEPVKTESD